MSQPAKTQAYLESTRFQSRDLESSSSCSSSSDDDDERSPADDGSTSFQKRELQRLFSAGSILFCVVFVGGFCFFKSYDVSSNTTSTPTLADSRRKLINPGAGGSEALEAAQFAPPPRNHSQETSQDDEHRLISPAMSNGVVTPEPPSTPSAGCGPTEELFAHLCYKKCSLLTDGHFPHRRMSNACGKDADAEGPAEVSVKGLFCQGYQVAAAGQCPHPPTTGKCDDNEELHLGKCYMRCSLLTNGEYSIRSAANTCCKQTPCFNPFHAKTRGLGCHGFGVGGGLNGHSCPHEPESQTAQDQTFAETVLK